MSCCGKFALTKLKHFTAEEAEDGEEGEESKDCLSAGNKMLKNPTDPLEATEEKVRTVCLYSPWHIV